MSSNTRRLIRGASGSNVGIETGPLYVEDVFSTYLYTGTGNQQTITNGIDLAGKGGLVWIKSRNYANSHYLSNVQGTGTFFPSLRSDDTSGEFNSNSVNGSFNDGFRVSGEANTGTSGAPYVSWTFRKQAKFFDVVTWVGDGNSSRSISHSLGATPGFIVIKRTDSIGNWVCWHRSISTGDLTVNDVLLLNSSNPVVNPSGTFGTVSSTSFITGINVSGGTYVAYLFAHDAGGFGDSGNESVVKCGSYTGTSSSVTVDLGWEPQWVLIKRTNSTGSWIIHDNMRGIVTGGVDPYLGANSANADDASVDVIELTPTGFKIPTASYPAWNTSGSTYIYIAIRRGPMKTPTDATKVFNANATTTPTGAWTPGFPVDALLQSVSSSAAPYTALRLTGKQAYLQTSSTAAEGTGTDYFTFDGNTNTMSQTFFQGSSNYIRYSFRRAPGFFDMVAWTGSATSTGQARYISHNLGTPVDLIIIKNRSSGVWISQIRSTIVNPSNITLNLNNGNSGFTDLTYSLESSSSFVTTTFSFAGYQPYNTDTNGQNYIAYLFGSCPGVSKVGSYTGTGTTLNIDCGFTNGARFVLIKRIDPLVILSSTPPSNVGDWYVWDTARGIVSGNDPYLLLNSNAAEVTNTDFIDPLSSGFQISSAAPAAINANGGSYIYLAIA